MFWADLSKKTGMTTHDVISTLESNNMLVEKDGGYEIVIGPDDYSNSVNIKNKRLYAKGELLTWVPYMVATKGDAGILNIPREHTQEHISTSDISVDAIIPSTSRQANSKHKNRLTRSAKRQREG